MQRISVLLLVLVVCLATAMQAQAPAPKPDPALKKLSVLVGHWTYEGEYERGPLGPGGKFTGDYTARMILGGFFLQAGSTERGPVGETRGLDIEAYDPVNKNFVGNWYLSDGSTFSGVLTVSGDTYTWAGTLVTAGKQYQFKGTFVFASDLASGTYKQEFSADGKTWTPFGESRWTKVKPAPKK